MDTDTNQDLVPQFEKRVLGDEEKEEPTAKKNRQTSRGDVEQYAQQQQQVIENGKKYRAILLGSEQILAAQQTEDDLVKESTKIIRELRKLKEDTIQREKYLKEIRSSIVPTPELILVSDRMDKLAGDYKKAVDQLRTY